MDDGWLKQPHLADSDCTVGLGEAAHLLPIAMAAGEFYYRGGRKFVNQTPVGGSWALLPPNLFAL